jgi:hypothetical protein
MEYKIGQIVNFKWYDDFYGKLIAFGNKIKYGDKGFTHSGIIYEVRKDTIVIAESLNKGFVKNDYEIWWLEARMKEGKISIGTAKEKLNNVQVNINNYLGRPYAWTDIFNLVLWYLFGKTSFKINSGSKALICSEAVSRVLYDSSKTINFEKEFKKSFDEITPQDLFISKQIKW